MVPRGGATGAIDGLYREMLAGFSHKIIAEMKNAICLHVIQVRLGMRNNRALAQKREGEDGMGVRSSILDAGKGSRGVMLGGGLLMMTVMLEVLPY